MTDTIILSVHFSRTNSKIADTSLMAGLLNAATDTDETHMSMGFDGCSGIMGRAFGMGIEDDCAKVESKVKELLRAGKKVIVNCYGHSRGGIAGLMLAKRLGGYSRDLVEVNLAMLDPVPGNLIMSAELDIFNFTLANQVKDMSECHNLNKVLCLYPCTPLPAWKFHAPVRPIYPAHTNLEEDQTLGCHSGPEYIKGKLYQRMAQGRFVQFMQSCGTTYKLIDTKDTSGKITSASNLFTYLVPSVEVLKQEMDAAAASFDQSTRKECHTLRAQTDFIARPRSEFPEGQQVYLNKYHRRLAGKENPLAESASKREMDNNEIDSLRYSMLSLNSVIYEDMSEVKQESVKGKILQKFFLGLYQKDKFKTEQDIRHALRNLIALLLQRDQYRYSFFSTTTSGEKLLTLLKTPQYKPLADLIMGTSGHTIRYRDLRSFVIGRNDESYFNARHRDAHYDIFGKKQEGLDEPEYDVTQNNLPAFLSRS